MKLFKQILLAGLAESLIFSLGWLIFLYFKSDASSGFLLIFGIPLVVVGALWSLGSIWAYRTFLSLSTVRSDRYLSLVVGIFPALVLSLIPAGMVLLAGFLILLFLFSNVSF